MKKFIKGTLIVLAVLMGLVAVFLIYVQATYRQKYTVQVQEKNPIRVSQDSAVIARGRYLVMGPAHCTSCHVPAEMQERVEQGEELPLIGGYEWHLPIGIIRSANITPDPETGIGNRTDEDLVRMLRYGISHQGEAPMPFMPFQNVSDEDLVAMISYLRAQKPVRHAVAPAEFNLMGKAVMRFVIKPEGPKGTPPVVLNPDTTALYGGYLANSVANCNGCHTARDMATGAYIGEPFAGGTPFEEKEITLTPPNLTPDPATGHISKWSEQDFLNRFRGGKVFKESHMPWGPFSTMTDSDLKAIYRYLQSLPPVENKVEMVVRKDASAE
jgi:mono/diheme cytochrome c family protein